MIKEIDNENIVIPFINSLREDICFSCPMYHSEEELLNHLIRRIKHPNDLAIAVYDKEEIIGVFSILIEKEEKYMEIMLCFSKQRKAYDEIFDFLEENYRDYKCDIISNPNNYILIEKLKELNANFDIEQNYMILDKFNEFEHNLNILSYQDKYKNDYMCIHTVERYWIAEKVINALDRFNVLLALENDKVVGYIDVTSSFDVNQPFDLFVLKEYRNKGYGRALLSEAIKMNFAKGMDLTVDIDNEPAKNIYKQIGFVEDKSKNSLTIHLKL